jgi:hypothetical protein
MDLSMNRMTNMATHMPGNLRRFMETLIIAVVAFSGASCSTSTVQTSSRLQLAVREIKQQSDYESKLDALQKLDDLTRAGHLQTAGPKEVDDIASLLDDEHDAIRGWAALSLGRFGPRARSAIPKLLEALKLVVCNPDRIGAPYDSELVIRDALKELGVATTTSPTCSTRIDSK